MSDKPLASALAPTISRFLDLKEALGRQYDNGRWVLEHLDSFLAASGFDLTPDTFARWCLTQEHLTSTVRRRRMGIVHAFSLYRRRTEPTCFVPDPSQFPSPQQPIRPHLFTEQEVARLLHAAANLKPVFHSPLQREVFRLAIVLLYTSGLRLGELLRLTVGDYDPREHTLLIRTSKFHKSRLLPLSLDGARELGGFLGARRLKGVSTSAEAPLLWSRSRGRGGRPYTAGGFRLGVRRLFEVAGIYTAAGRFPRVHDFRHTFAVHSLVRWYRAGANVQAKLPYLTAYLGHASVASTQYYLHFVDELPQCASERFARRCGSLVTSPTEARGGVR